jgi:transposase
MTQNDTQKGRAIEALGFGLSITEASENAGVTRKTIYRWLENEEFSAEVAKCQGEVLERGKGRLFALTLKGLNVLGELMESRNENIRLKASGVMSSRFTEILEVLSLEKRVEVLEREAKQGNSR